jgi:hypothetical protein
LNQILLVRFNTGPPGHLDEALRQQVVRRFFMEKKRRMKKTKISNLQLNSAPITMNAVTDNVSRPRKRIKKTRAISLTVQNVCPP